jgi:hypothetical protein
MKHFPRPWLDWLKETSIRLNHLPPNFALEQKSSGVARISHDIELLEFKIHTSLFCVRKIEESTDVSLGLIKQKFVVPFWPVVMANKHLVCGTPVPHLGQWYNFKQAAGNKSVSAKQIIDMFIHDRICNFTWTKELGLEKKKSGFVVSSDFTMKEQIFFISFQVIDEILVHAIQIFEPLVKQRELRAERLSKSD